VKISRKLKAQLAKVSAMEVNHSETLLPYAAETF